MPDRRLWSDNATRLLAEQRRVIRDLLRVVIWSAHALSFGEVLQVIPPNAKQVAPHGRDRRRKSSALQRLAATGRSRRGAQSFPERGSTGDDLEDLVGRA